MPVSRLFVVTPGGGEASDEWRLTPALGPILLLAFWLDPVGIGPLPPPEPFELMSGATTELELPVIGH